ncbi:MAG: NADH-quinone oxidoreductase subunit NuoF [Nitrospirae bacterium]|nr:NADH-quinone oxidoreductase subunit NuoF [Nitrospirota bacterium]
MEKALLKNIENPNSADIDEYIKAGGYKPLKRALGMRPFNIIEEVKRSGLRGRGGAGFSTGLKWSFAASDAARPKYLLCNADEGEPGTFKDRPILEKNPHLLIEGMVISAYALGAESGYIYLRGEYPKAKDILDKAIKQAYEKGFLGDAILNNKIKFHLDVHQGAGAYICGEETALISSLEGKRGEPRLKPPFPANKGFLGKPTVVNNVETLANVPYIIEIGANAYSDIGSIECPGPKLYSVSGHVKRPGVYELPMGTTLREIIYTHCGGIRNDKKLKAVIPGGISTPILPADKIDCEMDFVNMPRYGSMLGSGAVIVFDETVDMVKVCLRAANFFEHESCGKCTPCREGCKEIVRLLEEIISGKGTAEHIAVFEELSLVMKSTSFCALGQSAPTAFTSSLKHFKADFQKYIPSL